MDSDGLNANTDRLIIPRGEKLVMAGGRVMRLHTSRTKTVVLGSGEVVKVTIDDTGRVSNIVDVEGRKHAIARPQTIDIRSTIQKGRG